MTEELSLDRFSTFIEENMAAIRQVRREAAEIQVGFNSAYVEWKAQHDAAIERLVEAVAPRLAEVGPDLRGRVEQRFVEEQRVIAERRQELQETLIAETQAEADRLLQEGQRLTGELRQENPRLDKQEEALKAQRVVLEAQLQELNEEIRRLSGCLVVVFNFIKAQKLDRERQQLIGELRALQNQLKGVREEWGELQQVATSEQDELQSKWQEQALALARYQGERDYLDEEANREQLARKRATRFVVDNLKEELPCPIGEIKADLDRMVELNIRTDDYQDGIAAVSGFLSLLDGVSEGLKRFNESVEGLLSEQKMHSAHLPQLNVALPGSVVAFHGKWDGLALLVSDEGRLAANPVEFMATIEPVVARDLSEASVQTMFESMGQALDQATSAWRG